MQGRCRSLDEAFAQAALSPEALLGAVHLSAIALVVVAKQMQEAVQGQKPELGELRVVRVTRLTPRDTAGDHDLPQETTRHKGHNGHKGTPRF